MRKREAAALTVLVIGTWGAFVYGCIKLGEAIL